MVTNLGKDKTFPEYSCFFAMDLFWFEEIVSGNCEWYWSISRNIAHLMNRGMPLCR